MKRFAGAAALVALIAPAPAQAMSVAEFMAKGEKLKSQGMMAMMSPDLSLIRNEMKAVGTAYRADLAVARAKGRTDLGCPPPRGSVKLGSNELMGMMTAVPLAQRASTSVKSAFYAFMAKRFPCR